MKIKISNDMKIIKYFSILSLSLWFENLSEKKFKSEIIKNEEENIIKIIEY